MIPIAFSDKYLYRLPENHRFPIHKYELVKEQLEYEGLTTAENFFDPGLCEASIITLTHDRHYYEKVIRLELNPQEIKRIGLPIVPISVERARNSVAGTVQAAIFALESGIGLNTGGGTHHAFRERGEGFCVFNDIAVAANYLLDIGKVRKVLIVDLDVHQGNGTAQIFAENDRVFTFSMHGQQNYPLKKEKSDMDIGLPTGMEDEAYLKVLADTLPQLINHHRPDLVFYQAGVDVLATDKLGKLNLTKEGCKNRDEIVLTHCYQHQIPVVVTMGGGYSARIADIVEAHCNTFRMAMGIFG